MKKFLLSVCTVVTVISGASLLYAQDDPKEPCGPIPSGCIVTEACTCTTSGSTTICSDAYSCPIHPY